MNLSSSIYEKPLVINEINFETKAPVENGLIMIGDAAGMIAPLCGNGMAMAISSAKIASDVILGNLTKDAHFISDAYANKWNNSFRRRLSNGRIIQKSFFGKGWASEIAVTIGKNVPLITNKLIELTHGKPI